MFVRCGLEEAVEQLRLLELSARLAERGGRGGLRVSARFSGVLRGFGSAWSAEGARLVAGERTIAILITHELRLWKIMGESGENTKIMGQIIGDLFEKIDPQRHVK